MTHTTYSLEPRVCEHVYSFEHRAHAWCFMREVKHAKHRAGFPAKMGNGAYTVRVIPATPEDGIDIDLAARHFHGRPGIGA